MKRKMIYGLCLLALLSALFQSTAWAQNGLPTPQLVFLRAENYETNGQQGTIYNLAIRNYAAYADELFTAAPDLPPCGENKNSSRTWVDIYDARDNRRIYGYCALQAGSGLRTLRFAVKKGATPPAAVYVVIADRRNRIRVKSNEVAVSPPPSSAGDKTKPDTAMNDLYLLGLFFTGAKTDKIDAKNDKYVKSNGAIELSKSDATSCAGDVCQFNVGVFTNKLNESGEISTYGLFQVEGGDMVGNTIYLPDGETGRPFILPVKLRVGVNKLTFTIDPYKKIAETKETNNSLTVTVSVAPTPVVIPGKKNKP